MKTSFDDIIRRHCRPLDPIPTSEAPVLHAMEGIRAVMFDVYGTLLINARGDFEKSHATDKQSAFTNAHAAAGLHPKHDGKEGVRLLHDLIEADHARLRKRGIDYPEVDMVGVWERMTAAAAPEPDRVCRLAMEYELCVNPVWPMPHAQECLAKLYAQGTKLGIISNSQFYTLALLNALILPDRNRFYFDDNLQFYSYRHGRAKPGLYLFSLAVEALALYGIQPHEAMYVGNDMLNDIVPAHRVGFKAAFFAGDNRSLARRRGDPRVAGIQPDLIITDLLDLPKCIC